MAYFLRIQGKTFGPLNQSEMLQLKQKGRLKPFHDVSIDQVEWFAASSYAELFSQAVAPSNDVAVFTADVVPVSTSNQVFSSSEIPKIHNPTDSFYADLSLACMMTAIALTMHFINIQLQFFTLSFSLHLNNNLNPDQVILVVITIFSLLVMYGLFIVGCVFFIKAANKLRCSSYGISTLILIGLTLVFFMASSITFSSGKTLEAVRIGTILSIVGSSTYYSALAVLSFLYNMAFKKINRPGLAYSSHLLGFALIGSLFAFGLGSFIYALMLNREGEFNAIFYISTVTTVEILVFFQILSVWFLYHTFALRFYLTRILTGHS